MGKLGAVSRTHAASIATHRGLVEEAASVPAMPAAAWFAQSVGRIPQFA
jgi:hypothetical protein